MARVAAAVVALAAVLRGCTRFPRPCEPAPAAEEQAVVYGKYGGFDVTTLKGYEPGVGNPDLTFFTTDYLNQFDGLMMMANGDIGMTVAQSAARGRRPATCSTSCSCPAGSPRASRVRQSERDPRRNQSRGNTSREAFPSRSPL
jgi:hypothetical protein